MNYILILLLSAIFAAFGTVIGFGGGIFMIPILVIIFKVPINIAAGSVIVALIPGSLISSFYNKKRNKIDFSAGITLEIPTVLGTIIGAYLTSILVLDTLEIIFALFVSLVGLSMIKVKKENQQDDNSLRIFKKINELKPALIRETEQIKYRINYFLSTLFGLFAGVLSGLFGIGGGFLKTPIMVNVFNIPPSIAAATALFMIFFTSLTGSISHLYLGNLNINYSIPIVLGFILGAFIANKLNLKLSEKTIKILIGIGLTCAGVSVLIHTIL